MRQGSGVKSAQEGNVRWKVRKGSIHLSSCLKYGCDTWRYQLFCDHEATSIRAKVYVPKMMQKEDEESLDLQ